MKNYIQLIVVFAVGLGFGLLARSVATTPAQSPAANHCESADTDNGILCRMNEFQARLDDLKRPRTGAEDLSGLSKEIEAQGAILSLMTKFREREFAKFSAFSALAAVFVGSLLGSLVPLAVARLFAKAKRQSDQVTTP